MTRPSKHPVEVRQRAVRLVAEHREEYDSEWASVCSIAAKFGVTSETLHRWVRQAEVDAGARPGTTSEESAEFKRLKRANEILKSTNLPARLPRQPPTATKRVGALPTAAAHTPAS